MRYTVKRVLSSGVHGVPAQQPQSDLDTMRWGDTQVLNLSSVPSAENGGVIVSGQMLNAHWQRPIVWQVLLSVAPQIDPADAPMTFSVVVYVRVGIGQANQLLPLATLVFATPYAPQVILVPIPAENIQVQFQLGAINIFTPLNPADSITVTAMAAPYTEPRVMTDTREVLRELLAEVRGQAGQAVPMPDRNDPDQHGQPRWMPPGFDDGELRYRR